MGDCTLTEIDPVLYLTECGDYLHDVTKKCCGGEFNRTANVVGNVLLIYDLVTYI